MYPSCVCINKDGSRLMMTDPIDTRVMDTGREKEKKTCRTDWLLDIVHPVWLRLPASTEEGTVRPGCRETTTVEQKAGVNVLHIRHEHRITLHYITSLPRFIIIQPSFPLSSSRLPPSHPHPQTNTLLTPTLTHVGFSTPLVPNPQTKFSYTYPA